MWRGRLKIGDDADLKVLLAGGASAREVVVLFEPGSSFVAVEVLLEGAAIVEPGQHKGAKFSTFKAHISASFHSFRLIFGRVIISPHVLVGWMLFLTQSIAKHSS